MDKVTSSHVHTHLVIQAATYTRHPYSTKSSTTSQWHSESFKVSSTRVIKRRQLTTYSSSRAAEIDRTLKRVQEGVQVFDDMYDKFMLSTNTTQKDKLETDLKTQIKKLQRMRDQVKSWQTSNDIKDKGPLDQTRKVIETVSTSL